MIDARSAKTSSSIPVTGQGIDAGKKIAGRKRSIATDPLRLLLATPIPAAGVQDSAAGTALPDQVAANHPDIRTAWGDADTARKPGTRGFTLFSKRWAVERTYGWLMLHRCMARDY